MTGTSTEYETMKKKIIHSNYYSIKIICDRAKTRRELVQKKTSVLERIVRVDDRYSWLHPVKW